ncbi:11777_t:CDS:2 [Cetraspora pellucida]|uniref:11777_t:CDS:1 n=1 Tax=Cetraspora pellucida TaxID=1433469 RepID=A0ACA9M6V6_9GLOM|nr:11777_t:CDS:2 [Cetraspora pellucida]
MAKPTTTCIIINNEHSEICCYNNTSAKKLHKLIGVWKINKDTVHDVNKELYLLECYEKNDRHLHVRLGSENRKDPGCAAMHLDNTTSTFLHFLMLIEIIAQSENVVVKGHLLQALFSCLKNFDLNSSFAQPNEFSNLFVVNTTFKIKEFNFFKQQFIQNPKIYKEFRKSLVIEVLRSCASLASCKLTLENLNSLQQYYEAMPKCLTVFFDSLVLTLQFQKHEVVKIKQKEHKTTIAKFNKSEVVKNIAFLSTIILTLTFRG